MPPRGRNAGKLRGKSYFVRLKNVIPAQAGIQLRPMFDEFHGTWIPAFAGMAGMHGLTERHERQ